VYVALLLLLYSLFAEAMFFRETGHKYPSHNDMEDLSTILSLTYKQIKGWFIEKRRRDKSKNNFILPPPSSKRFSVAKGRNELGISSTAKKTLKLQDLSIRDKTKVNTRASSKSKYASSEVDVRTDKRKKKLTLLQDLVTPGYILAKVFRKDGPPLGVEFDSLPSKALSDSRGTQFHYNFSSSYLIWNIIVGGKKFLFLIFFW